MTASSLKHVPTWDDFLIVMQALAFAIEGMSRLPDECRPPWQITVMKNLLSDCLPDDDVLAVFQSEARRRVGLLGECKLKPLGRR